MELPVYHYDEDSSEMKNVALGLIAIANEMRILTFGNADFLKMGAIEGLTVKICDSMSELKETLTQLVENTRG